MTVPQVQRYFLPSGGRGSLSRYVALQLGQRVRRIIDVTWGRRAGAFYGLPRGLSTPDAARGAPCVRVARHP